MVMTTYHYGGTCRMGQTAGSVVDERLRVRGTLGLRVADASIMPVVPVSALNAPSMMIGWRAADLIREDRANA
jgi:choline dehydrogenase